MIISMSCLQVTDLNAQDLSAREVMNKVRDRDQGTSQIAEKLMIFIDKRKQQHVRQLKSYSEMRISEFPKGRK